MLPHFSCSRGFNRHAGCCTIRLPFVFLVIFSLSSLAVRADCRTYDGVLAEPVTLGAWLYAGNCRPCHDSYASARLAETYADSSELITAIGERGCKIAWARNKGGSLGGNELAALAAYMQKWEEQGGEPTIPPLPPQPEKTVPPSPSTSTAAEKSQTQAATVGSKEQLSQPLAHLIAVNPVAAGGYLYTRNCYRCHLAYEHARMARGISKELVLHYITEGKTSTQMRAFSRMLGGPLKGSEIKEIVAYISAWEERGESPAIAEILMTPPALDPADFRPIRLTRFQLVEGDIAAGSQLFRRNCGTCHGVKGEGFLAPGLNTRKPAIRTDLFVKSVIKTGIPGSLMSSWTSGPGPTLSAKEIDDIVSTIIASGSQ